MTQFKPENQKQLWDLVYGTLYPKPNDATPNACLNRLTNERLKTFRVNLNESTAFVLDEQWLTDDLVTLDRKHERFHDFDDERPIVVVDVHGRKLLVDGNHRVTRWLMQAVSRLHRVLLIRPV